MSTEKKSTRQGLSKRLKYLHSVFGMNVRFMPEDDPPANTFVIPDTFKGKPYLEGVDNYEAVFTKLDGAETLIGKNRTPIPNENSTPDEVSAFNVARGVPESHDDYKPLNVEEGADNTFFDAMKPSFKKAGLTQKGVEALLADLNPVLEKITGQKLTIDKELDADFDVRMDGLFGTTKETDLANAKALMALHTPESMKADVTALGNKELAIMASVMKGVRSKYIKEDGNAINNLGDNKNTSKEELRIEGQKQIAIAQDTTKTQEEREAATVKANEVYAQYDSNG